MSLSKQRKHTIWLATSKDRDVVQIKGFCISCKRFSWDFCAIYMIDEVCQNDLICTFQRPSNLSNVSKKASQDKTSTNFFGSMKWPFANIGSTYYLAMSFCTYQSCELSVFAKVSQSVTDKSGISTVYADLWNCFKHCPHNWFLNRNIEIIFVDALTFIVLLIYDH